MLDSEPFFFLFFTRVFDNRRIIKLRYGLLGVLKGAYGWLVHFGYSASYSSSFAIKLEKLPENDKLQLFVEQNLSSKHYINCHKPQK